MKATRESTEKINLLLSSLKINITEEALDFLMHVLTGLPNQERKSILSTISKQIEEREKGPVLTKDTLFEILPLNKKRTSLHGKDVPEMIKKQRVQRGNEKKGKSGLSHYFKKKGKRQEIKSEENTKQKGQEEVKNTLDDGQPFPDPIIEVTTGEIGFSESESDAEPSPTAPTTQAEAFEPPNFKTLLNIKDLRVQDLEKNFLKFFESRYDKLRGILKRKKLKNLVTTERANEGKLERENSIIILVNDKRTVKNGKGGMIWGEDKQGEMKLFVPLRGRLEEKFDHLLKNSVIACEFHKSRSGLPIVDDILFPNVPFPRKRNRASHSVKALMLSDFHIGSKDFLKGTFKTFLDFIRGETEKKEEAVDIKYIIVTGDLVDGAGVYPNQERELEITDIKRQYELLYNFVKKIPENKQIIMIPGNHDAAGRLLPQPPPPFLEDLNDLSNVTLLSNPALVEIEGVKILLFHGQGFEGIAGDLGVSINSPTDITKEVLKQRHLSPLWGGVSNFPTEEDSLVIETTPDILVTGHLHVADYKEYKGTLLLNPSAFQGRTSWQRELGIEPTPGRFPMVDLKSFKVKFFDFR